MSGFPLSINVSDDDEETNLAGLSFYDSYVATDDTFESREFRVDNSGISSAPKHVYDQYVQTHPHFSTTYGRHQSPQNGQKQLNRTGNAPMNYSNVSSMSDSFSASGSGQEMTENGSSSQDSSSLEESKYRCATRLGGRRLVSFKEITPLVTVGKGAGGVVKCGMHEASWSLVAIKSVNVFAKDKRHQLLKELTALSAVRSPFIVSFYGAFYHAGLMKLVLQYMNRGSILDYVSAYGPLNEPMLRHVSGQLVTGLHALHKRKLLHRDIKPANILIDWAGNVKLTDFGILALLDSSDQLTQTYVGTLLYMSPERLRHEVYTLNGDIWSLGLVLYYAVTGQKPYLGMGSTFDSKTEETLIHNSGHKRVRGRDGGFGERSSDRLRNASNKGGSDDTGGGMLGVRSRSRQREEEGDEDSDDGGTRAMVDSLKGLSISDLTQSLRFGQTSFSSSPPPPEKLTHPQAPSLIGACHQIVEGPPPSLSQQRYSEACCDFVSKCLIKDPKQRWSTSQLLQHPFLKGWDSSKSIKRSRKHFRLRERMRLMKGVSGAEKWTTSDKSSESDSDEDSHEKKGKLSDTIDRLENVRAKRLRDGAGESKPGPSASGSGSAHLDFSKTIKTGTPLPSLSLLNAAKAQRGQTSGGGSSISENNGNKNGSSGLQSIFGAAPGLPSRKPLPGGSSSTGSKGSSFSSRHIPKYHLPQSQKSLVEKMTDVVLNARYAHQPVPSGSPYPPGAKVRPEFQSSFFNDALFSQLARQVGVPKECFFEVFQRRYEETRVI